MIEASQGNPRRVKRLSNSLNLVRSVAQEIARDHPGSIFRGDMNDSKLAILLMMQVRYPLAFHWWTFNGQPLPQLETTWDKDRTSLIKLLTKEYGESLISFLVTEAAYFFV